MNNQPKPAENNFATPAQSDETRLSGELDSLMKEMGEKIVKGIYISVMTDEVYDTEPLENWLKQQILAWNETEKQNLLKKVWNLSQPGIVPDGWKPDTKLGKYLSSELNKSKGGKI